MSEKQDVICLSHREDPDGIVSAVLIKHLFNAEIYLVDYAELLIELKKIAKNKNLSKLFICDFSITPNIQSEFMVLLEDLSKQNIPITYFDHHKISNELRQKLNELKIDLINSETDCSSAIIFNHHEKNIEPYFTFLTSCASITDNLENGPIGKKIISKYEKMYLYLNSSILWFHIRNNQNNPSKLYQIVDNLADKKSPYEILDDYSSLKSHLKILENKYVNIQKNTISFENFNCIEISDGKFSDNADKLLATSNKNISLVYKKNNKDMSVDLVILSNDESEKNLGSVINSISKKFNGAGGGDKRKSAAVIPQKYFENFLNELDSNL